MGTQLLQSEKSYTYFISDHHIIIENERIEEGTLINSTNDSVDPYDCQVIQCDEGFLEAKECNKIHSFSQKKKLKKTTRRKIYGELRDF